MNEIKLPSNKSFGLLFFIVFSLIAIYQYKINSSISFVLIFIASLFLLLGIINSKILTPFNKLWMKFGLLLGKIVSPIVMGVIFFFVITPISFILKIFKKDVLNLKKSNTKSYWVEKDKIKSKMKNQF